MIFLPAIYFLSFATLTFAGSSDKTNMPLSTKPNSTGVSPSDGISLPCDLDTTSPPVTSPSSPVSFPKISVPCDYDATSPHVTSPSSPISFPSNLSSHSSTTASYSNLMPHATTSPTPSEDLNSLGRVPQDSSKMSTSTSGGLVPRPIIALSLSFIVFFSLSSVI